MRKDNLICKIFFFDKKWEITKRIIGVVDINQLFSPLDEFIELKNYGNKTISKKDLVKIFIYEEQREIGTNNLSLELNNQTKIEG